MDKEQQVRDMLNECYPVVEIGGLTFDPVRVVEELDPIAFRCMVADYQGNCSECSEALTEDEEEEGICAECKKNSEQL